MSRFKRLFDWVRRHPVALCLPIQAALLFHCLELLPAWTDEGCTLLTVPRPLSAIAAWAAGDVHPPLYFFLLHFWLQLPLPGSSLVRMRALSVLFALLATWLIDRLWLARLPSRMRLWFLALWTFSPCLVLYARMARSYTMQLAVAGLAWYAAWRWLEAPRNWRRLLLCAAGVALVLYVHYVPGGTILLAVNGVLALRLIRRRDWSLLRPLALWNLLVIFAILPWLVSLAQALGRWARPSPVHPVAPNFLVDGAVRLAYWFVSFSFGESSPLWAVVAALALTPLLLYCLWRGLRPSPPWLALILPAAVVGFIGVSRWLSSPFLPARLLFLLPFYLLLVLRGSERSPKLGALLCGALLLLDLGALHSYFRKEDFLNKGYAVPFDQMAELVKRNSPGNTLVVLDQYNTDAFPLLDRLQRPAVLLKNEATLDAITRQVRRGAFETIWHVRNTHDLSPRGLNRRLEERLTSCYEVHRHLFQPYSVLERWAIRQFGWPEQPTHFYQALQARRKPGCAAAHP